MWASKTDAELSVGTGQVVVKFVQSTVSAPPQAAISATPTNIALNLTRAHSSSWNADEESGVPVRRVGRFVGAVLAQVETHGPLAGCVELDRSHDVVPTALLARLLVGVRGRVRVVEIDLGEQLCTRRRRARLLDCRSDGEVHVLVPADRRIGELEVVLAVVVVRLGVVHRRAVVDRTGICPRGNA